MPIYLGSPKHCEPITAERPGIKCPAWSRDIAQQLLDNSVVMGEKRVATRDGVAFVAQLTHPDRDIWHGYPEAWIMLITVSRKIGSMKAALVAGTCGKFKQEMHCENDSEALCESQSAV